MEFVYLATLVLCLGLVRADDSANPLGDITKMLNSLSPAALCPKISALSCQLEAAKCVDIPDVMDCAQASAMCTGSAQSLCGCLSDCGPTCAAKADCSTLTGPEEIACKAENDLCVAECEAKCPVAEINKAAQASFTNVNKVISGLTTQIQGLLSKVMKPKAE